MPLEDMLEDYRLQLQMIEERIAQLRKQEQAEGIINRRYMLEITAQELTETIKEIEMYSSRQDNGRSI